MFILVFFKTQHAMMLIFSFIIPLCPMWSMFGMRAIERNIADCTQPGPIFSTIYWVCVLSLPEGCHSTKAIVKCIFQNFLAFWAFMCLLWFFFLYYLFTYRSSFYWWRNKLFEVIFTCIRQKLLVWFFFEFLKHALSYTTIYIYI